MSYLNKRIYSRDNQSPIRKELIMINASAVAISTNTTFYHYTEKEEIYTVAAYFPDRNVLFIACI